MRRVWLWIILLLLLAFGVILARWQWGRLMADPGVALLFPEGNAQWIRMPKAEGPETYGKKDFMAAFRVRFNVDRVPEHAVLYIRPFRHVDVFLDKQVLGNTGADFSTWKQRFGIELAPLLTPGEHELVLSIINRTGPPAVLAYSPALGLYTGPGWEAKDHDSKQWSPAVTVKAPPPNSLGTQLPTVRVAFVRLLPLFAPLFLIVFLASYLTEPYRDAFWRRTKVAPAAAFHWVLLGAWAVLAASNIIKLPYSLGFDVDAHLQYMLFIIRNRSVPFADQGWQMFQSPLYYLVSAPLYVFFSQFFSPTQVSEVLRIIPILCGGLQIHLCYRVMRTLHPERQDLQALGTLLGGFMPINFYLSQNLGNEPLMALFASFAILLMIHLMREPEQHWNWRTLLLMGILVGLALLTKATALLLVVPAGYAVVAGALRLEEDTKTTLRRSAAGIAAVLALTVAVAGWYYIRNWLKFGSFFIGGWDEARGFIWWQEPGYRILQHYTQFGAALVYPVYSAVHGFWDGLYSTLWLPAFPPPIDIEKPSYPGWNYGFVLSSAWLGLLPTLALLMGAVAILRKPFQTTRSGEIIGVLCLALFIAAMLYLSLRIPSFSTIKASYTLALLTSYAIVGARGFGILARFRVSKAFVYAWMACWAVSAYAAHFVW